MYYSQIIISLVNSWLLNYESKNNTLREILVNWTTNRELVSGAFKWHVFKMIIIKYNFYIIDNNSWMRYKYINYNKFDSTSMITIM